jgi:bifunctional non-homologous end joining protein LigD
VLPHLAGRALTFKRFPNGVDKPGFFEKRCPKHRPDWVPVATGPGDRDGPIGYCVVDEPAALVWAANLAALELHAPMALADDLDVPRAVVFDLDPGAPAALRECAEVDLSIRTARADRRSDVAEDAGSKGLQIYVPVNGPLTHEHASAFALAVGQVLEKQDPARVLTSMAKVERKNKVFVDWSQNNRHKTTIAPYSLRARDRPTVSTPVSGDEVIAAAAGDTELRFEASDVLARVERDGDLFAPVLTERQTLVS